MLASRKKSLVVFFISFFIASLTEPKTNMQAQSLIKEFMWRGTPDSKCQSKVKA
jgi:hypothetical protein